MPAILAVFVFISNQIFWDVETSPVAGMFSIFMALWGTFFLVFWRRRTEGLNILWDDYVISHDAEDLRKQFKGKQKVDPVTDEVDTFFSWQERLPLYLQSFLICFPCWCIVLLVIVAFLNITGVIRPDHHGGAFDIPALSQLADAGNWCDPDGYLNMAMAILQAVFTIVMNIQFRKVAIYTAELENHKTQRAFNNSVFIKRFIFEFTDFQLYLFYIGIY